jgi:hypothetical protein
MATPNTLNTAVCAAICSAILLAHPAAIAADFIPAWDTPTLLVPGEEAHLKNVRQLTRGHTMDNPPESPANFAEAYWAPDGKSLILQATVNQYSCDQLFSLDLLTDSMELISPGKGRVT